ncbi:MAG: hypothetical protein QM723_28445 [Myxococcaceae bacterium]
MSDAALGPIGAEATLIDRANFVTRFAGAQPDNACVRKLHALLTSADPATPLSAVSEWLEDVAVWIHDGGRLPSPTAEDPATVRLKMFLDALDDLPEQRRSLQLMVARCFAEGDAIQLFADTGLPSEAGFFSEMSKRMSLALLPEAPVMKELSRLLHRLFPTARSATWFEQLPEPMLRRLFGVLAVPTGDALEPLRRSMREASVLLSTRVSAAGLHDELRERLPVPSLSASPFLGLPRAVQKWVDNQTAETDLAVKEALAACRKAVQQVHESFNQTGISLDLVYQLESISRMIDRLYKLVTVSSPQRPQGSELRLLHALVRGGVRDRSLKELWRTNSKLLARRVIERVGHGGEHYITSTRAEQHEMVDSAGGGGAITGLSVLLKFVLMAAGLPPLIDGLAIGLNYASAFIAMQLTHSTLGTKQPAMTAAALAGVIHENANSEEPDLEPLAEMVARTIRSQLAAFLGNFGLCIPVVIGIDLLVRLITGHHFFNVNQANAIVAKHHPFLSPTLIYAACTGVFLWSASVVAGTVENWVVVRQLPEAIASNRLLRSVFGAKRAASFSAWFLDNVSGLAGNFFFGMTLGMMPFLASLIGLPLEVRHFTFVTGQLAFAGMALGPFGCFTPQFAAGVSSIILVGTMNFAVSFSLAMFVALRAREVGALGHMRLASAVGRRFLKAPLDFIRAPKTVTAASPAHTH